MANDVMILPVFAAAHLDSDLIAAALDQWLDQVRVCLKD